MNSRCKREIKVLETQKKRALQKEDLTEAAKICNVIGETLSSFGCFDEAIDAHKEEVHLSEAINDVIGVAVGNRKVGECLCELRQFDDAIKHQQKHLKLARSVDNVLEQQRALATLGRTYFVQAEDFDDDPGGTKQCLKKSEKAYFQSLELCNTLSTSLTPKEFLQMKSRLYLNLGLVYEWKQDYKEALKFVSKALLISKEQKLRENTYRCHYTLSGLYLNAKSYQKALQSAKSAVMIGKEMKSKQQELDAQMQLGVTLLRLGEFSSALQALKQVYKASANENPQSIELIIKNLKFAMKGVKLQTRLDCCTSEQERMTSYEHFGDLSYDVMCPEKAIEYYQKQLDVARELRIEDKLIAPIYISIAVTYSECKEYGKALEFYQRELKLRKNDLKEKSSTYCAIGKCLEDLERPYPEIKEIYMKAIECAQSSGHIKTILKAYKDWAEVVKVNEGPIMHENVLKKIATLRQEMETEGDDSQEAVSSPLDDDGSDDVHLTPDEVEMLESDDEGNDEEENHLSSTSSTKQRTSRESKKKVKKVNERGETPLHVAAINGNIARVEELLKLGADVKARDYCGWQPIHEASNHGFYDIVKLLLEYGSDVNDPGGAHCGGITPLHDASQNGHLKVVKLLLEYNADVYVKCKEGHTPLQLVQTAIRNDEEELTASDSQNSESLLALRRRVAVLLRDAMTKKKRKSLQRGTNKSVAENRNRLMFEDFPDSETMGDRAGFQENAVESTDDDDDLSPGIPFKKKKLNPEDDLLQRQLNQSTHEEKDSPESPQSPCIAKPFVPTDTDDLDMNVPRMSSTTNQPDSENDDDDDEIMQLFQQQECSEKLEDEDSNYESMAEDMSPPVVFVNDTTPDAIPSTSVASEDERPLEVGTSRTKNRPNAGRPNSRTQHKTSSAQRRLQTRINFSRSPSPATNMRSSSPSMFTEGDRRLQDFIIDDESSRKKGNGKQRQSRIDFTVNAPQGTSNSNTNHRPRNSTNTQNRRNLTTANKGPKSNHRQRHIDNYHPIEIQDENDANVDNRLNTNHIQSTAAASTQPITRPSGPIFRVKVRISNHCLLVPCQQADEKTIKWLIDQASERYYSLTGVATTISLQTQDGAHLNPSDVITNVIDNNEEICGLVLGLKFPPLVEQYTTKCKEKGIDQLDEITEVFSLEEELRSLSLNNMYISTSDIETVFPCISCNVHITAIDVSNSYIGKQLPFILTVL
ncbi:tonsoku-like protein [Clytia hemisphaerica]|uniref:tonsoku-like protein n=1 Tax=Clytia hemisphaerica TaxID=252671 RepID=UPI0034D72500